MANKCKYYKEKQQVSYDFGVTWLDTGNFRKGSLIEYQSSDCPPHSYENQYLTFRWTEPTASTYTNPVKLLNNSGETLSFSIDKGVTWSAMTHSAATQPSCGANDVQYTDVTVSSGDTIWIKHTKENLTNKVGIFATVCDTVEGNVMSLLYGDDFIGKTSLSGTRSIFSSLFEGVSYCYEMDLKYAHNLVLPATLGYSCYASMFQNCIDLITTPILSATTLAEGCYSIMFAGCKSLTTLPELPATALTNICYLGMFERCTSLTTVPTNYLPSTTLGYQCYYSMFADCTSLTTAPDLPATTLVGGCYQSMFQGCTSLTTAPTLSATTLISQCYRNMFSGCTSLSSITCLATDISVSSSTLGWVIGVPSGGTFIRDCNTNWSSGDNGIPNGWTDNCIQPKFIATYSDLSTYELYCDSSTTLTRAEVTASTSPYSSMTSAVIGDCITAIDYVGEGAEGGAFYGCSSLTSVTIPNSVVTIGRLAFDGCRSISSITISESVRTIREFAFLGCDSMTSARIPSGVTSISTAPYEGCDSLTSITVDNNNSVYDSRNNCNAIVETSTNTLIQGCNVTVIPNTVTSIGHSAFANFVLTSIDIPSSVTAISGGAFFACGLTSVTIPNSVTVIDYSAFLHCNDLTSVTIGSGVTLIGNQAFQRCSSLTSITINATTPPTLGYYGVFEDTNNCPIYVPCESVDVYKAASGWTTYASRIQGIEPCGESYSGQYLTFVAEESGTFNFSGNSINYSLDGGSTWASLTSLEDSPTVQSGSTIMWKGTLTPYTYGIGRFSSSGRFKAEGNVMSLLYGDNFSGKTDLSGKDGAFYGLFNRCSGLTNVDNLKLVATTLTSECYRYMFQNCSNLTSIPSGFLPATTLDYKCYNAMFYGCSGLTTVPSDLLPATTLSNNCYQTMFSGCTSLTTAPILSAATLINACYASMFRGCSSLSTITCLATDISANTCVANWVSGVASNGTFYLPLAAANPSLIWSYGDSGIPSNWYWSVIDAT